MKKVISVVLATVTLFSLVAAMALSVSAAKTTAYDILSTSNYAKVYTVARTGRTIPYTSKYLSTRGSVTNGRSSTAYIDNAADELYVFDVGVTNGKYWAYVSYPTSRGRLKAYIPLSAITANNGSHAKTVSQGKFYCARRQGVSTSSSYYVAKGDTVYLLSTSGSTYQVLYPVSGGKWRIAFCSSSDYQRYCAPKQNSNSVGGLRSPVPAGCRFNKKTSDNGWYGYHDINRNVSKSTPVYASASGKVTYKQAYVIIGGTKYLASYGNYCEFVSSDGTYRIILAHLDRFNGVSQKISSSRTKQMSFSTARSYGYSTGTYTLGSRNVSMGDVLGYIGTTGNSSGVHLHIEVYKNGKRVDPTSVFSGLI